MRTFASLRAERDELVRYMVQLEELGLSDTPKHTKTVQAVRMANARIGAPYLLYTDPAVALEY